MTIKIWAKQRDPSRMVVIIENNRIFVKERWQKDKDQSSKVQPLGLCTGIFLQVWPLGTQMSLSLPHIIWGFWYHHPPVLPLYMQSYLWFHLTSKATGCSNLMCFEGHKPLQSQKEHLRVACIALEFWLGPSELGNPLIGTSQSRVPNLAS